MLFTVSTVKECVAGLKRFVARNLAGGVDHVFLFVDDARPRVTAALDRHPHVTADRDRGGLVARGSDRVSSTRASGSTRTSSRRS